MNAPNLRIIGSMDDQFHKAISYEVEAVQDALAGLALPVTDMRTAHRERQIASLKAAAVDIATRAGQMQRLAAHISYVCDKHLPGSKSNE